MTRLLAAGALLLAALLRPPAALALQTLAARAVADARQQIEARNLDSARTLLRRVVAAPGDEAPALLVEAWVLLGVVEFYQGRDSAAAQAFREAFVLDPQAQGHLPDPDLQQMFDGLRPAQIDIPPATTSLQPSPTAAPAPAEATRGAVYRCTPRCDKGVRRPALRRMRPLAHQDLPAGFGLGQQGVRGYVIFQGIVGLGGILEPGSVHLVASTSSVVSARDVEEALQDAEFSPGEFAGHPVRVMVQFRYECRLEGLNMMSCSFRGP